MTMEVQSSNLSLNLYTFISVTVVLIILLYKKFFYSYKNLPPGPIGVPILGYVPFMDSEPHKQFYQMRKKYGDMIGIKFGLDFVVILNEYDIMKETLSHPAACTRECSVFSSIPIGISQANGQKWIENRRFCMNVMKNIGFDGKNWEKISMESISDLLDTIASYKSKPVDTTEMLHSAFSNNIIKFLIGRKYDTVSEKDKLQLFVQFSDTFLDYVKLFGLDSIIPGFKKMCETLGIGTYGRSAKVISSVVHLINEEIRKHDFDDYKEVEDFINVYNEKLKNIQSEEGKSYVTDEYLLGDIIAMFLGGNDTVYSSTGWLIRLMAKHQDVQRKVQQELDEVIGREGTIYYYDRMKVPYTFAVILESQRYSSIVPLSTTRVASEDFEVREFTIPKGTLLIGNLWAIHNDPSVWKNPDLFMPERFLTNDGKVMENPRGFGPFSFGRRNCPGRTIAFMLIFLSFTKLLQRFTVSPPVGQKVKTEIAGGLIQYLEPQELSFTERT